MNREEPDLWDALRRGGWWEGFMKRMRWLTSSGIQRRGWKGDFVVAVLL